MADNKYFNQNKKAPEGLSSIADDEAITEIDLGDFLEENSKSSSPLFDGFHEDIENSHKSLTDDIQNLYDNIMSSGPETIVPKPMSVLTEKEKPRSALDELWMNPEDYFDADIPVVSLDDDSAPEETEIFEPVPEEIGEIAVDDAKSSIFSMIDMLKKETDTETGTPVEHVVWFDDARSIDQKLRLLEEYTLRSLPLLASTTLLLVFS